MNSARLIASLVVTVFALACSGSASAPTSPSSSSGSEALTADQLTGTWNLKSVQPAGQAEQSAPAGVAYSLTLADGRLSTRVDCNTCAGAYTLAGQTLTAGPALACTRAACSTMAFESVYTSMLSGDNTVTVADGVLALSSSRGVLRFARPQ